MKVIKEKLTVVKESVPLSVDSLLQDIAQSTGAISYNDIIKLEKIVTPEQISYLQRVSNRIRSMLDHNEEPSDEYISRVVKYINLIMNTG